MSKFLRTNYWCNLIRLVTNWKTTSLLLLILVAVETHAQDTGLVTGTVTSEEDEGGLPGVNVFVKNTDRGTITDLDGKYSLEASASDTLVISYIGYVREEIPVGNQTQIDVVLSPNIEYL